MENPENSAQLDLATLVSVHRMLAGQGADLASCAAKARRLDVLEALWSAGELSDPEAADRCISAALALRDLELLGWMVDRGMAPLALNPSGLILATGQYVPKDGVARKTISSVICTRSSVVVLDEKTWVEGIRRMLDAGVISVNDLLIDHDYDQPTSLLNRVLKSDEPRFALELIDRGAEVRDESLSDAILSFDLDVVRRFASQIKTISFDQLIKLRVEFDRDSTDRNSTNSPLTGRQLGSYFADVWNILDEVVGRCLSLDGLQLSRRSNYALLADVLSWMQSRSAIKSILQRNPHVVDSVLYFGCRNGSLHLVQAAVESGGRVDTSETDLKKSGSTRMEFASYFRNSSPYLLHNVSNAEVLQYLLDQGSDISVKWDKGGVLHYAIYSLANNLGSDESIREGEKIFTILERGGVDFAESFNGRTVMQVAAKLPEPLKRLLTSIRTGSKIGCAMGGNEAESAVSNKKIDNSIL